MHQQPFRMEKIPADFWSAYRESPFVTCVQCEVPLAECSLYVIQKSFVRGEAVFEMAICERCRTKLVQEYSEETLAKIRAHLNQTMPGGSMYGHTSPPDESTAEDHQADPDDPPTIYDPSVEDCLSQCAVCEKTRDLCRSYAILAVCDDDQLFISLRPEIRVPMMVCDECGSGLNEMVSQKTRDSWDRFVEKNFDGPPGIEMDSPTLDPMVFG